MKFTSYGSKRHTSYNTLKFIHLLQFTFKERKRKVSDFEQMMCFILSFGNMPVIQDHRTHELMIRREALLLLHLLRCLYKYLFFIIILQFLDLFYGSGY